MIQRTVARRRASAEGQAMAFPSRRSSLRPLVLSALVAALASGTTLQAPPVVHGSSMVEWTGTFSLDFTNDCAFFPARHLAGTLRLAIDPKDPAHEATISFGGSQTASRSVACPVETGRHLSFSVAVSYESTVGSTVVIDPAGTVSSKPGAFSGFFTHEEYSYSGCTVPSKYSGCENLPQQVGDTFGVKIEGRLDPSGRASGKLLDDDPKNEYSGVWEVSGPPLNGPSPSPSDPCNATGNGAGALQAGGTECKTVDLQVAGLEVVQVVQTPDGDVKLVAGKTTVARLFVRLGGSANREVDDIGGTLTATRDGVSIGEAPRIAGDKATATLVPDRGNADNSLDFALPDAWTAGGKIVVQGTISAPPGYTETNDADNTSRPTLADFKPRNRLKVAYFNVCLHAPGSPATVTFCPQSSAVAMRNIEALYPLPDKGVDWQVMPNDTTWETTLSSQADWERQLGDLKANWILSAWATKPEAQAALPQALVAFVDAQPGTPYAGLSSGQPFDSPVAIVDAKDDFTLPHELGHILGLQHTTGNDEHCGKPKETKTDWQRSDDTIGEVGWDVRANGPVPARAKDLMSYCPKGLWLGPFHYGQLFDRNLRTGGVLAQPLVGEAIGTTASVGGVGMPDAVVAAVAASSEIVVLRGSVTRDGTAGGLEPGFRIQSPRPPPADDGATGDHCLRFEGASGVLAQHCFTPDFLAGHGDTQLDSAGFAFAYPYPAGTVRIRLMAGERELASLATSARAPTISIQSVGAGDSWSGQQDLSWSASDPDGGSVQVAGLYSTDGDSWLPLAVPPSGSRTTIDTSRLDGDRVWIRLFASDGLQTATSQVGPIAVVHAGSGLGGPGATSGPGTRLPPGFPGEWDGPPIELVVGVVGLVVLLVVIAAVMASRRRPVLAQGVAGSPAGYPGQGWPPASQPGWQASPSARPTPPTGWQPPQGKSTASAPSWPPTAVPPGSPPASAPAWPPAVPPPLASPPTSGPAWPPTAAPPGPAPTSAPAWPPTSGPAWPPTAAPPGPAPAWQTPPWQAPSSPPQRSLPALPPTAPLGQSPVAPSGPGPTASPPSQSQVAAPPPDSWPPPIAVAPQPTPPQPPMPAAPVRPAQVAPSPLPSVPAASSAPPPEDPPSGG